MEGNSGMILSITTFSIVTFSMTFSIMALSIITFSTMTFSIMTFSITTLSIIGLFATLHNDTSINNTEYGGLISAYIFSVYLQHTA